MAGLSTGIGWCIRVSLAALAGGLIAQSAPAADLLDVYQMARENDPVFQSAKYALDAARQKVPEAISALLPSIGASATGGRTLGNTSYTGSPLVQRGFSSYTWVIQLTQPLLRAQGKATYDEARAVAEQGVAQYRRAEQDLALRVAQAYFDILIAREGVAAGDAQRTSTQEQLAATRRGFEDGTVAITDVHEAESHDQLASAQSLAAINDLEAKRAELEAILGQLPSYLSSLRDGAVSLRPDPNDVDIWIARAKSDNPSVLAAAAMVKAAHAELNRAQFQRLPTIDLVGSIGRNYSSGNINNPSNYATNAGDRQIGVQLSLPLIDGGGIHAVVREAKANEAKAESDLEAARRKSGAEAREAFSGINNGLAQIEALRLAVASGESSVTGNRLGYQLGIRINSEVLDAQRQLYSSRRDLVKARYDTLLQALRLKAAAGILSEGDIREVSTLLSVSQEGPS